MTTISGTTAAAAAATTTTAAAKSKTLGQGDFLTLLVAQLKNQHPLNPSDPTQFTSQLAQYSQLEQLFNLNDSMGNLSTAQNNSDRLSSLSLIGQDVVVQGSDFALGNTSTQLGYQADGTATSIKLNIQNSAGKTVGTLAGKDLTAGNHFLTWDGKDSSGNMLPPGTYTIAVDAKNSAGASVTTVLPLVRATVTGVDLSGSEAKIVTGAGEYKISAISGAYNSSQSALDSGKS